MDTREQATENFDPDGVGATGSLFGLPFLPETSQLIIIPVPWEVTVSYSSGTANGPQAVLEASTQVELFVDDIPDAWKMGMTLLPISEDWKIESERLREEAYLYMKWLEDGKPHFSERLQDIPQNITIISSKLNQWVKSQALKYI
ncbi:MAG: arginase family protein, partial [Bacteroidota bacterium]|nr:arginase family protein [Bacteroidota bacterium]